MKRLSVALLINFIICLSPANAESLFAVTNSILSTKTWADGQICPSGQQQDASCLAQCSGDSACEKSCPCTSSMASNLASGQVITGIEFRANAFTYGRTAQLVSTHTALAKSAVLVIKDQNGKVIAQTKLGHLSALDFKNNYPYDLKVIMAYLKQASAYTASYKLRLYLNY